jgi:hypothetical protein
MTQTYFPFDSGSGANVTESQWSLMAKNWMNTGVIKGALNELLIYADSTGMQVKVKSGQAWMQGHFFQSDAEETLSISNADSTNPRIDRVIVRVDWTANTIQLAVLSGTPAASPSAPNLTQNGSRWEISLAQVYVGANVSTIATGNITDERDFTENKISTDSTTITRSTNFVGTQKILFSNLKNKTIKSVRLIASFNAGGISRASWGFTENISGPQDKCIYAGVEGWGFNYYSILINGATVNDYLRARVTSFDIDGVTLTWETGGGGLAAGSITIQAEAIG